MLPLFYNVIATISAIPIRDFFQSKPYKFSTKVVFKILFAQDFECFESFANRVGRL